MEMWTRFDEYPPGKEQLEALDSRQLFRGDVLSWQPEDSTLIRGGKSSFSLGPRLGATQRTLCASRSCDLHNGRTMSEIDFD